MIQTRIAISNILLFFLVGVCVTFGSHATVQAQQIAVSEDFLRFVNAKLDTVFEEQQEATKGTDEVAERKKSAVVLKQKQYGFSFLGQGFLGVYSLGVAQKLVELKVLKRNSQMYAASSGAVLAGSFCAGGKLKKMISETKEMLEYCSKQPTLCLGEVDGLMRASLKKIIPAAKKYKNCGRTHISTSYSTGQCNIFASPPDFGLTGEAHFFKNFNKGKNDLISVILASAYIPSFSSLVCNTEARGKQVVDGGFVANSFCFRKKGCVKVFAFPPTAQRPVDIYPGLRPNSLADWPLQNPTTWQDATRRADIVAPVFDQILEFGRKDAQYWYNQQKEKKK